MGKIISMFKGFLFLSLIIAAGAVTNSLAQDAEHGKDDWVRGKEGGCPGGFYLDFMPAFEAVAQEKDGVITADGWVCIRAVGKRGYIVHDNEIFWPPQ